MSVMLVHPSNTTWVAVMGCSSVSHMGAPRASDTVAHEDEHLKQHVPAPDTGGVLYGHVRGAATPASELFRPSEIDTAQ